MALTPQTSDMYACQKCDTQIQIVKSCDCETACAEFCFCGQPMNNITEPTVKRADDTNIQNGFETAADQENLEAQPVSMAKQAEQAKNI